MDVKSLIILKLFCILIFYFNIIVIGDIPYGLCANPTCSVPVSRGIVILRYHSPDDKRISVEPNDAVEIYVKEFGPKKDLWGILVKGNKGYISKKFIRETVALNKNLVPAVAEFKTAHLMTSSTTVTNHLHVSSEQHEVDKTLNIAPEAIVYTQTVQQEVFSSLSGEAESQWNKPSEQLQGSHSSPPLKPSDTEQFDFHFGITESSMSDNPDHSSHFNLHSEDVLSPSHVLNPKSDNVLLSQSNIADIGTSSPSSHIQLNNVLNNPSENPTDLSDFPPNSVVAENLLSQQNFQLSNGQFQQSSQQYEQFRSSQSMQQQNTQPLPSMQQENSLPPSSIQKENFLPPQSMMQQDSLLPPSMQQQVLPLLNIQQQNSQSPPSMQQHTFNQPSMQHIQQSSHVHQQVQTQPVQETQSSLFQDVNNDYSDTFAMLHSIGIDDTDIYGTFAQPHLHQSSQNFNPEFGAIPSQSQHTPTESSDTLHYSSSNINPSINQQNEISDSLNLDGNKVSVNPQSGENLKNTDLREDDSVVDDMNIDEFSENELEAEADEDQDLDSEIDDSEDEEEYTAIKHSIYSDSIENNVNKTIIHSSTSSIMQQESEFQSSSSSSDYAALKKKGTAQLSKELHSSDESSLKASKLPGESDIYFETETTVENHIDKSEEVNLNSTNSFNNYDVSINPTLVDKNSLNFDATLDQEVENKNNVLKKTFDPASINTDINEALQTEDSILKESVPSLKEFFPGNDQKPELNKLLNSLDDGIDDLKTTYQVRNLKGETVTTEESLQNSGDSSDENITLTESDFYSSFQNGLDALKSILDSFISWMPDPLYSLIMDLQSKGISPRVPVFTAICGFTIIFFLVPIIYIKECSKEAKLANLLAKVEKDAFHFSATNAALEEKLGNMQSEIASMQAALEEEKTVSENIKTESDKLKEDLENAKAEFESCLEELESLREKECEYQALLKDYDKDKGELIEQKNSLEKLVKENEDTIANLMDQLHDAENNIKDLEKEKVQYLQLKEDFEEKLAQFESNCNQLLEEAEVWNLRVNELTTKVNEEKVLKEEIEVSLKEKDEEIESLKQLVETFKSFDEIEDPEEQAKTKEEKLDVLMKSSVILSQLKKQEEETRLLVEQLGKEKNKILDMEVELLEAKSEIDKLKMSYNQALQDKAEAQTKLDVLTNYFKDKEIQLQKQLGAQEAVRQKKEEDASSAERRITLIEQENASYKYQVASMKQEMEETERNLKSQIAVQEKKAHENWIAARAAERKLEDMKQEVTQLRQRLTLLEREQESWANASREEIIRPVPKRLNDESVNQDLNTTERGMFPPMPPPMLPPPMMLPPDRPLPPLLPPPMFMPPMERHFRSQPWHLPPDSSSDFRSTPPDFPPGRESTPPRGRPYGLNDRDAGPHASSPLTTETRDSRNSTPPYLLPDFHDVPPQPGRPPFFPPPMAHPRLPMHPPYRREPGSKRLDNTNDYSSKGPQQSSSSTQEQWQHSRV